MNKDQIKGTLKTTAGKVQEAAGKLVGSPAQQAKGVKKQITGKTLSVVGDVKQLVKDSTRR